MSTSASIDLHVPGMRLKALDVLEAFVEMGWSYNDHGHISYVPIGSKDDFDWQWTDLDNWPMVRDVFRQKEQMGEMAGISLILSGEDVGGDFLFDIENETLMVSLTVERRCTHTVPNLTDFTWYLERLLPVLLETGLRVAKVTCCQC